MLKALLKKQFLELNTFYFQNKKTGKHRSKAGTILYVLLFVLIFVGLAGVFFFMASNMAVPLMDAGMTWLYFTLMGIITLLLGVFGSVFNTYAGLYHAKDNELLLSMPIPPSRILFARMVGVYAMGLLYESIVYIPAMAVYFVYAHPGALAVVGAIVTYLTYSLVILTLTCVLGWLVALISGKLKNKSFLTVIVSLVFLGVYYFICMNFYTILQTLILNSGTVGAKIRGFAYPLYLLGMAGSGHLPSVLITLLGAALLTGVTYYVLSATFLKIATRKDNAVKAVYKEAPLKVSGTGKSLFMKELKRFTSSATYMLNCALGTILMPISAVAALIFMDELRDILSIFSEVAGLDILILLTSIMMMLSMNTISAPSVSLEGKTLWVAQTLPVDPKAVLQAKLHLHWALTLPVGALMTVCFGIAFQVGAAATLLVLAVGVAYGMFIAALGLTLNLKHPNLTWTNETAPVKQSMAVMICLLGGWLVSIVIAVGGYFAMKVISAEVFLVIVLVVLAILTRLLHHWLSTSGAKIYTFL